MALVCTSVVPVVAMAMFLYVFMLQNMKKQTERIYDMAGGVAEQAISGIKTVKCLRGEDFEVSKYEKKVFEAMK